MQTRRYVLHGVCPAAAPLRWRVTGELSFHRRSRAQRTAGLVMCAASLSSAAERGPTSQASTMLAVRRAQGWG
eukprot:scaffold97288_cov69-Phaeocystis_antarctica.AAC.4